MKSEAATVDAYLEEVPEDRREALESLRAMVLETAPEVDESMAYGMPTYMMGEEMLCAIASQKANLAFYLCDHGVVARHKPDLKGASCGKSCIRIKKPDAALRLVPVLQGMLREALENP